MKYLLCGIDGVLHVSGEVPFGRAPQLEGVLRSKPELQLVIFDHGWEGASMSQVREAFSSELRARILDQGDVQFRLPGDTEHEAPFFLVPRQKGAYLKVGHLRYRRHSSRVIECDPSRGFDRAAEIRLRSAFLHDVRKDKGHDRSARDHARLILGCAIGEIPNSLRLEPKKPTSSWQPQALTIIPSTSTVELAVRSGAIARRIWLGLERIYVSEWALLRAPGLSADVRTLAMQFPDRLLIIPFSAVELFCVRAGAFGHRLHDSEYFGIGHSLKHAYKTDLEAALWPRPPYVLRIGAWPRRAFGWIHQMPVGLDEWSHLDMAGMQALEQLNLERRQAQERRAVEAFSDALGRKEAK